MREFNKMKQYCKDLGLQLLYFTKRGHAVYGDPNAPQHVFIDSAPHATNISEDYYQNAKRTAANIKSGAEMIEHFIAAPLLYEDRYTFFGVHNRCARDGNICHEIYVPGVGSATGAGDTLDEAMEAATEKLTFVLRDLQLHGFPMPTSMSAEDAEDYARNRDVIAGFTVDFIGVVELQTLPGYQLPVLSDLEQEALQRDIQEVWRTEQH